MNELVLISIVFVVLTAIGAPLFAAVGLTTLLALFLIDIPYTLMAQTGYVSLTPFPLLTIPLFVALPIFLVPVQKYLLGMDISLGGVAGVSGGYVAWMLIFACFQIYLRILSGSVWTTVGFHLAFVLINHLIGPDPGNFIHISELSQDAPVQPVAMLMVGLVLAGLIAWPWLAKAPVGWRVREGGEMAA